MSNNEPFNPHPEPDNASHAAPGAAAGSHPEDAYGQQAQWGTDSPYAQTTYNPQLSHEPQSAYGAAWNNAFQTTHTPAPPLASWGARAGARLLDMLASWALFLICAIPGFILASQGTHSQTDSTGESSTSSTNTFGVVLVVAGFLALIIFDFWNRGLRQGKTGQSLGKKFMHLSVIDENTSAPAGSGAGAGRWAGEAALGAVNACVGILSLLDILWPLWDVKNQSLHDKMVHTVVVQDVN